MVARDYIERECLGMWSVRTTLDVEVGTVEVCHTRTVMYFHPDTYAALEWSGEALVAVTRDIIAARYHSVSELGSEYLKTEHPKRFPAYWEGLRETQRTGPADDLSLLEDDLATILDDSVRPRGWSPADMVTSAARLREAHAAVQRRMDSLGSFMAELEAVVTS